MSNPLMQSILARAATAQGETNLNTPVAQNVNTDFSSVNPDLAQVKTRTEQVLNQVLASFGGVRTKPQEMEQSPKSIAATRPTASRNTAQPGTTDTIVFKQGESGEACFFSTQAPYQWGYLGRFPAHLLAAVDELSGSFNRLIRSSTWEVNGQIIVLTGEATEPAGELLDQLLKGVQARLRQELAYPAGKIDVQLFPEVGQSLSRYFQQTLAWRVSSGEAAGYIESEPPIKAAAYLVTNGSRLTSYWQGDRLWLKGSKGELQQFLQGAADWILARN